MLPRTGMRLFVSAARARVARGVLCCALVALGAMPLAGLAQVNLPFNNTGGGNTPQPEDSTKKKKNLARRAQLVQPYAIRYGGQLTDTFSLDAHRTTMWDETDTLRGFVQSLGLIGKPYQHFHYGLSDYYQPTRLNRDPMTGRPEVYTWNNESQVRYMDTRTPFVNMQYDLGQREMELLRFNISQNITPYWNGTASYRRRTAQGPYLSFNTDHYNIAFSQYVRSRNNRYQLAASLSFSNLNDQMNGGVAINLLTGGLDSLYRKFESPIRLPGPNTSPLQGLPTSAALGADLLRRHRNVYVNQSFALIDARSTKLYITAGGSFLDYYRRYRDRTGFRYLRTGLANPYRTYGFQLRDTLRSWIDEYYVTQLNGYVGGRFEQRIGKLLVSNQLEYEEGRFAYRDTSRFWTWQIHRRLRYEGMIGSADTNYTYYVKLTSETTANEFFSPDARLAVDFLLGWRTRRATLPDSLPMAYRGRIFKRVVKYPVRYSPLVVSGQFFTHSRNPSFFNRLWRTNTFRGDSTLINEQVTHLHGNILYTGAPKTRNGHPYLQNYVGLTVFGSVITRPIVYDSLAQPFQAGASDFVSWQGATFNFRVRAARFYLQNTTTFQVSATNNTARLGRYTDNQPNLYSKTSLFWRFRFLREGLTFIQMGTDAYYTSSFRPHAFDPSTQVFYPQFAFTQPGYLRLDAYLTLHIKWAVVYIKMQHLNEGPGGGYLTTPFYPMLERMLWIGINWTFWD
jgi:hypothetical protein